MNHSHAAGMACPSRLLAVIGAAVLFDHSGFLEKGLTEQYLKDAERQMESLPIKGYVPVHVPS